jgi:SAM-dependent methyltransferase
VRNVLPVAAWEDALPLTAKITGERVASPEGGFNPTWQRHVAAYGLSAPSLPDGRVLDLGCGVGHSYHLLAPRETIGVDIDAGALAGQQRETRVADMRALPFADGEFPSVLSVQSLEHVPDPDRVLTEVARVLEPGGVAVFVTPNRLTLGRPDEIIDPYHYVEFDAPELRALCERRFGDVVMRGLFGSPAYMELFDEERRTLDRTLARDPLRLRRLVPMRAKQWLYDTMLRRYRRDDDPRAAAITPDDFELRSTALEEALDVVAICSSPRK